MSRALPPQELAERLQQGDRHALARAITLVESTLEKDQVAADELFAHLKSPASPSFRLGITGAPGVGKSTFIDTFGTHLCDQGHRVAVLAIDPSSPTSGGSLLGDKTRMDQLSLRDSAFIRPSPASTVLGGLAIATSAAARLCEAAGYDFIIIETVGTGQSERHVVDVADAVLLLVEPGGGDGLQASKRGLIEHADFIAVTKADGDLRALAEKTLMEFTHAPSAYTPRLPARSRTFHLLSMHDPASVASVSVEIAAFAELARPHQPAWRSQQAESEFLQVMERTLIERVRSHPLIQAQAQAYASAEHVRRLPFVLAKQTIDQLLVDKAE
ncbi:MAG: hypothetical protein JNM99_08585 [Verrucomicrobiaceae bacterium]|nr:hypothetical protein [Verrucomicrobiaceae bacterium]